MKHTKTEVLNTKKLVLTALFAAVSIAGSSLSFPIFGAKCAPVQHTVNILAAVFLGPYLALASAFCSSLIRNMLGMGTIFAFPGSMFGAFLAGLLYERFRLLYFAYIGELCGTAIIGAICSYPIAYFIMGNSEVAIFSFVIPFLISSAGGTIIAVVITKTMEKTGLSAFIRLPLL